MASSFGEVTVSVNIVEMGWICPICKCGVNPKARRCKCVKPEEKKIEDESVSNHHLTEQIEEEDNIAAILSMYPHLSPEQERTEAIVREAAEKIKARGAGVILKDNEPTGELNIPYGQDVRIKVGEYAGLHGAYVRDQVTERGMGKAIALYSKDVQVVLMDDEIEVVDKDMKDWSVTGK
jgi:hypothetical protein